MRKIIILLSLAIILLAIYFGYSPKYVSQIKNTNLECVLGKNVNSDIEVICKDDSNWKIKFQRASQCWQKGNERVVDINDYNLFIVRDLKSQGLINLETIKNTPFYEPLRLWNRADANCKIEVGIAVDSSISNSHFYILKYKVKLNEYAFSYNVDSENKYSAFENKYYTIIY